MKHASQIKWNDQRNNNKSGFISPGSQCGYTSVCMALSSVYPEAESDDFIGKMIDDIEPKVGKPGWGEKFFERKGWKGGWIYSQVFGGKARAGAYMEIYAEWLKDFLKDNKLNVDVLFVPEKGSWQDVKRFLKKGFPVVIGTKILPSGHFILLVDYDEEKDEYTVKGPWGDASSNYKVKNGDNVKYSQKMLNDKAPDMKGNKKYCRYITLVQKGI